jgi:hypothetical protein
MDFPPMTIISEVTVPIITSLSQWYLQLLSLLILFLLFFSWFISLSLSLSLSLSYIYKLVFFVKWKYSEDMKQLNKHHYPWWRHSYFSSLLLQLLFAHRLYFLPVSHIFSHEITLSWQPYKHRVVSNLTYNINEGLKKINSTLVR